MKESMCSRWHLRLIVLLILFFPLTLSAAQGRVTVKGQSITLRQAIKIIESSSNFKFFFNPSDLDALPSKNLDCEGEISDVLKEVFAGSGISYVIMGDDIILKLEKKAASTQQKKVEIVGGVVDARSGESVVGATVRVKDVNSGVITDMDGKFTIKATPGDVLVISYIGYETKEVKVVNGKVLLVELVEDAKQLVANGCLAVCEGANMPTTLEATEYLQQNKVIFAPGKAANAGGVATSALEMSQNSERLSWTFEEVDAKLQQIMVNITHNIDDAAKRYGQEGNYVMGANIAGFEKVVDAMMAQGIV